LRILKFIEVSEEEMEVLEEVVKEELSFLTKPKEEGYFYAHPQECLQLLDEPLKNT